MRPYKLTQPTRALQRARLDNLALVPANLLPYKEQWQSLANDLPEGDVLLVVPSTNRKQRQIFEQVALLLRAKGRQVTTIAGGQLS